MNSSGAPEVLIVEDSLTQAEDLRYVLDRQGYATWVARNGREAYERIRARKPNLVITDVVMPEMDGFTLCRKIKSEKDLKDLPVMLLTALSDAEDILKGLECGADDFITKPYDPGYLIPHVANALSAVKNAGDLEKETEKTRAEIVFGERRYVITSGQDRILELLLSTYETAVIKNRELKYAQQELKAVNEQLENKIKEGKRVEEALKESEKALRNSLQEKETLLRELYHRTKNNMHLITNLISLQMASMDTGTRESMKDLQGRIQAMAMVHEKLYKRDLSKLDLRDYITDLANALVSSYLKGGRDISMELSLDSVIVSIDTAIPCGLIMNELVSNCLKYAFPAGKAGVISICLKDLDEKRMEMRVSDNGKGLPEGLDIKKAGTMGLKIVYNLARQLMGAVEAHGRETGGTEFIIRVEKG